MSHCTLAFWTLWLLYNRSRRRCAPCPVFAACSCRPAMAQQDGAAKKNPAVAALHSHFMVGSVSEENSEDEIQGKPDMQLEEKETRSLSPSSGSSDSTYEMGFDHIDGPIHNLRLDSRLQRFLYFFLTECCDYDTCCMPVYSLSSKAFPLLCMQNNLLKWLLRIQ